KNIAGGDLGLESEEEKTQAEEAAKENEGLFAAMQEALDGKVTKVAVSTRLSDAPAALTAEGPISLEMEKILAQMPESDEVKSERVLEVNTKHPVFATLQAAQTAGDSDKVKRYTSLLYDQALLVEGMPIEDPIAFALAVSELMV
ncbi:MAG: molecular chaperone HtpG, partial [Eggerthellaceae bacterium]|nr:molecular chaperone HtpG [Eggerthellaceae bacterium]